MRARLSASQRFLILCILCGIVCGLVSVAFHLAIRFLFEGILVRAQAAGEPSFLWILLAAPTFGGLVVGLAIHFFAPSAVGGGIPQTREAYYNKDGHIPLMAGVWRFLLGIIYLGFGNSLGREGPVAHMCSSFGSALGRWGFRDKRRARSMMPVGMGAGLAAAFNAPLSAITFVFEQLMDNFSMRALGGIVLAVVAAAALSRSILGDQPILGGHLDVDYTDLALDAGGHPARGGGRSARPLHRSPPFFALRKRPQGPIGNLLPGWSPARDRRIAVRRSLASPPSSIANARCSPTPPDRAKAARSSASATRRSSPPSNHELLWQILAVLLAFQSSSRSSSAFAAGRERRALLALAVHRGNPRRTRSARVVVWFDATRCWATSSNTARLQRTSSGAACCSGWVPPSPPSFVVPSRRSSSSSRSPATTRSSFPSWVATCWPGSSRTASAPSRSTIPFSSRTASA